LNWHTVLSNFSYFGTVTKLLLLVKIWVDGILTTIIEVYVLRDHNGSVRLLLSPVLPKKPELQTAVVHQLFKKGDFGSISLLP